MTNLVSNFEYLFVIAIFLTVTEFWNLLESDDLEWMGLLSDLILMSAEIKNKK